MVLQSCQERTNKSQLLLLYLNGAVESPLNIILFSQINMSNLNNLFSKNAPSAYCLTSPFSTGFGPSPFLTLPFSSFPFFHQQSTYSYLFPQNFYFPSNPQSTSLQTQPFPSQKLENMNKSEKQLSSFKIQSFPKNEKVHAFIQISDDEEKHQIEKKVKGKPTKSQTKLKDNTPLSSTNNKSEILKKQKSQQKTPTNKKPPTTKSVQKNNSVNQPKTLQVANQKMKKVKPIVKPPQQEIKKQHNINLRAKVSKIKEKYSYRLSRKQKQSFQIGRLRDHHKQIMTGPQFQAKLPVFSSAYFQEKLQNIRQNLLHRQYQEEEY